MAVFPQILKPRVLMASFARILTPRVLMICFPQILISSAKLFSAEEVDLSFNQETKEHPQISDPSFWKRDRENVFLQMF